MNWFIAPRYMKFNIRRSLYIVSENVSCFSKFDYSLLIVCLRIVSIIVKLGSLKCFRLFYDSRSNDWVHITYWQVPLSIGVSVSELLNYISCDILSIQSTFVIFGIHIPWVKHFQITSTLTLLWLWPSDLGWPRLGHDVSRRKTHHYI